MIGRTTLGLVVAAAIGVALALAGLDSVGLLGADTPAPAVEPPAAPSPDNAVSALGRIEPNDGIIRVAGPSQLAVVIGNCSSTTTTRSSAGQPIAVLDTQAVSEADRCGDRCRAAQRRGGVAPAARRCAAKASYRPPNTRPGRARWRRSGAARARQRRAGAHRGALADRRPGARSARPPGRARRPGRHRRARRDPTRCTRSPRSTRPTSAAVRVGQRATVTSPALPAPLQGSGRAHRPEDRQAGRARRRSGRQDRRARGRGRDPARRPGAGRRGSPTSRSTS